jgi:alanine-glyoxylate transaminase/serine-glyoxylate transaminase/serine-pyruvate transaminase
MSRVPGRSLYAAPGPTNIPDAVLAAVAQATTDFMAPRFQQTYESCVASLQRVLGTTADLHFYASSGHGAWEATMANLFSPGDLLLMPQTGVFSGFWSGIARSLGLRVQMVEADPRLGIDLDDLSAALEADRGHAIRAVCVVHNDTASGVTLPAGAIRERMDAAGHPALYVLDVISSAGSLPLALDDWRVDAAIGSSQKGLMMLPGLGFAAVSAKAMAAHRVATLPRAYFDWSRMADRPHRHSAGTISAALFNGLRVALELIEAEGLDCVLARHARLGRAVRAAIAGWHDGGVGPALYCRDLDRASHSVSAILLPPGCTATAMRRVATERFNVTFGGDLGLLEDRLFRIGHMGDLNEAMLLGMLGAAELSLAEAGIPHGKGVAAALAML